MSPAEEAAPETGTAGQREALVVAQATVKVPPGRSSDTRRKRLAGSLPPHSPSCSKPGRGRNSHRTAPPRRHTRPSSLQARWGAVMAARRCRLPTGSSHDGS